MGEEDELDRAIRRVLLAAVLGIAVIALLWGFGDELFGRAQPAGVELEMKK